MNELKRHINNLLQDYKGKSLLQHISLACDGAKLEFINNVELNNYLELYLQQLEMDEVITNTQEELFDYEDNDSFSF